MGQAVYPDGDKRVVSDGTWTLRYHDQRGGDPNQDYNELLLNCLSDGVPIGVMVKSKKGGFDVLGLAAVEAYDRSSHMFLLHGPVRLKQPNSLVMPEARGVAPTRVAGRRLRRQRGRVAAGARESQPSEEDYLQFRSLVFEAYEGACAITESEVPELLDAAFIRSYQDKASLVVSNGILLRADVCRLYDTDLISITPGTHVVSTSERLAGTGYARLRGCELRLPQESWSAPNETFLEERYRLFEQLEKGMA